MSGADPRFIKKAESAFNDADWEKSVIFLEEAARASRSDCRAAMDVFRQFSTPEKKGACYRQHVLAQVSDEVLAHLCLNDYLGWGDALAAKASHENTDKLKAFYQGFRGRFAQNDLDLALRAAVIRRERRESTPNGLLTFGSTFHYETGNRSENVLFLLKAGARPHGANSDLLLFAVKQNNLAAVLHLTQDEQVLREAGALALQQAAEKKHDIIHYFLQQRLQQAARFHRADDEILVENTTLDLQGGQLRTVFNFATQRVTEIFENNKDKTTALTSCSFAEYDPAALQAAHAKLRSLGGSPRPLPTRRKSGPFRMDKP